MSEAIAPKVYEGVTAWVQWVNKKTNDAKKEVLTNAGLKVPGWVVTSAGLSDPFQRLKYHLFTPIHKVYAEKSVAHGGAIPGTGMSEADFEAQDDETKKESGLKQYGFVGIAVVDEENDRLIASVFEINSIGHENAVKNAARNFNRDDGDKGIPFPPFRILSTGDCTLVKNAKSGNEQTEGSCSVARVKADSKEGVRALKFLADPQFQADMKACKSSIEYKIKKIIEGDGPQEA